MSDIENTGSQINKHIGEGKFDPLEYMGGENNVFPNGLIIKMGVVTCNIAAPITVTFDVPFPNDIITVVYSMKTTQHFTYPLRLDAVPTASSFIVDNANAAACDAYWLAIGY